MDNPVSTADVEVIDSGLAPGYGLVNDAILEVIHLAVRCEGVILDPI